MIILACSSLRRRGPIPFDTTSYLQTSLSRFESYSYLSLSLEDPQDRHPVVCSDQETDINWKLTFSTLRADDREPLFALECMLNRARRWRASRRSL